MNVRFNSVCALIAAILAGCAAPNTAGPVPNAVPATTNFSQAHHRDVRLFVSDYGALSS
jgi:hypothetical protein